jgi:hypothetical protein
MRAWKEKKLTKNSKPEPKKIEIAVDDFHKIVRLHDENYLNWHFYDHCIEYLSQRGVPEKYRSKVYSLADADGHAYGRSEIVGKLMDLAEIFDE